MADRPDFYNPINYSIVKKPLFRFDFPGLSEIQINYSQLHQDLFVLCVLGGKRGGVYCEIGAHEPVFISNTYLLEQQFGWSGLGFELDKGMVARHSKMRRNPCFHADALTVDFRACMEEANLPLVIDYLSVDIDPSENSLKALQRLPHDRYRFRVITFEHDLSFGGDQARVESRMFLEGLGYHLLVGDVSWGEHVVEDWWVEPDLIDPKILRELKPEFPSGRHEHDQYFYRFSNESHSSWQEIPSGSKRRTGEGLCVEGWRDLNHSYSLVNQWQLIDLLHRPCRLWHRDLPPFASTWNPERNASGLPEDLQERIQSIPSPNGDEFFSVIYRIAFPLNLADGPADRIIVFGTSELGHCNNMFVGSSPAQALARGNLSILTSSNWSKEGFLRSGFKPENVAVLPLGVSPAVFSRAAPELRLFYRQLFGFAQDDFILLNLGALTANKGVDLLLLAYARLKEKFPQLKLVIKDQSNLYSRTLNDLLREMTDQGTPQSLAEALANDVITISENLDMHALMALYNACDLYVSPYRAEGFNLPPLEAAACGLPILVTAGGSTDDYFDPQLGLQIPSRLCQEKDTMFLSPDLDALQNCIESFLHQPHRWGGSIGSQWVHGRYSWQKIGDQFWSLLGVA
jgi:glycosyltransferase involved in cell wall biosynthesis